MDSGLASSMRPGMTNDDELNYPSFNTDTKNPSVPVRRGVIKSPSAVQNRRVDKASGSRERAPDDRLREAIHSATRGDVDCFVAPLLAMTKMHECNVRAAQ